MVLAVGGRLMILLSLLMMKGVTTVRIGDLVKTRDNRLGVIIKMIDDYRYDNGILNLKVHLFADNTVAWFSALALTVVTKRP